MHAPAQRTIPLELLLAAYRSGIFPMSDSRDDEDVYWVEPRERAILPLDGFRCSRSLAKAIRQDRFRVTCDAAFAEVIHACAAPRPGHPGTWISRRIAESYHALHAAGHAHSIECWQDGELVGGLYGVAFDRVFCGESMFSRRTDASKVALGWLVVLLRRAGFLLLDCQFMTEHLASLGAVEIERDEYLRLLAEATAAPAAQSLPEAYSAVLSAAAGAASAGVGEGEGVSVGEGLAEGAARGAADGASAVSCPGKLIAQSLTHTS
ncbi:leucyl/phenylalanyl-tRNA--protein transferase [Altererythrobacter sp. B11]|uniref:leucyl/phenylalanyl-tRNA--protein transferase n=1 Tax=Altererythrobacter sp. B11 TaxID=2060312 RepID=UPI000DC6F315|nr:leucyl/phenylalanyl-tRNA--protein transferase [Altererythrobacter sp. B11]BBC71874.1 leucyl/phenylalanyl-tRNA--protein transferase [Altererythrobacter sp. B11]